MSTTRTFVAVAVTDEIRRAAEALARKLSSATSDVKWVAPENMHWTLQFLGDVEQTMLAAVCDAVARGTQEMEVFSLEARGAGAFPKPDRPRTLWLGAGQGSAAMIALQASIESELAELGFRGEHRRYVPHLTLGRAGRGHNFTHLGHALAELAGYEAGRMAVEEVIVFGSQLSKEGPTYHVIGRAPLVG